MSSFSGEPSVFNHYQTALENLEQLISASQWRQAGALIAALAASFTLALLYFVWHSTSGVFWMIGTFWAVREFTRLRARALQLAHLSSFYEQGLDRLKGAWQGKGNDGNDGTDFSRPQHLYQDDLSILGAGSLFELLCTTRSQAGAERLASYLLDSPSLHESKARQEAVRELRGRRNYANK